MSVVGIVTLFPGSMPRKCVQMSHDWLYLSLIGQESGTKFLNQTQNIVPNAKPKQVQITFDTQVETALTLTK